MVAGSITLALEREYDFSPSIVFDALVDPDLIGGWLGDAAVEQRLCGRYDVVWLTSSSFPPTFGTITTLEEARSLTVATDNRGELKFQLEEKAGGSRGTSTILHLRVSAVVEPAFVARVHADWLSNLDQLGELLHGHPVDWANWDRDRAPVWREYLRSRASGDS